MHNTKKLILAVFTFTLGFATAAHAQQVNTLFTKRLPEAPGKEIEVILSITPQEPSTRSTGIMRTRLSTFSTGDLRCKFAAARFGGLVPGRYFANHLTTFIP
jgi:hypothetical protein